MENYDRIIEKISRISGVEKEEIERKIEAKRAKLSGLISKEGAAQVIAAELGISFDNEKLKIEELLPGMRKVNTTGKVMGVSPVRTFKTKKGDDGKVVNLFIADETSNIKVVLWDTNHIGLVEAKKIGEGIVVEIVNGTMRENELHLGSFSELKTSNDVIGEVKAGKVFREKKISELKNGDTARIRAFIVQSFEPKFFYICPECRKKAIQEAGGFICAEHGKVAGEKRALISTVIDDGTETIRTVAFHETLKDMGLTEFDNPEELSNQRMNLLGKEMFFSGTVRVNKVFNTPEFTIESAEPVNIELMIKELEA
ncbi:Replication factor A [uncultured archaeon]|nr:Replication factor A [uncultured archaeon]